MTKKSYFSEASYFHMRFLKRLPQNTIELKHLEKKERFVYRMSNDVDDGNKNFEETHCV